MKVNFNQKVKDHRGKEVDIVISEKLSELMWYAGSSADHQFTREEKFRAYKISQKLIAHDGNIEIDVDEASFIKDMASKYLAAGVFGQVCDIIENVELKD
ncbi:MAG: hypothetical protein IKU25_00185 [Clostridia bacterium]|nr:hypothetical protein [Clostridia bacterium]